MASLTFQNTRVNTDVLRLMSSKHQPKLLGELNKLIVKLYGPIDSPYEGGMWNILIVLPENYPFRSPSIGFMNTIFHPNIDERSGTVCLDVINETWTPLYNLCNIFDIFLPQLLSYPNPEDPLNSAAAALYLKSKEDFEKKVADYIVKYATEEALQDPPSSESSLSDISEEDD